MAKITQAEKNKAKSFGYLTPKPKPMAVPQSAAAVESGISDADYAAYLAGGGWGGTWQDFLPGGSEGAPSVDPYANWDQSLAVEVPGEYFDAQQAIQGDWEYTGAQERINAQNLAARTQLGNQRRQALIDLGIIPAGLSGGASPGMGMMAGMAGAGADSDPLADIDDVTREQIANNPYSAWAQANNQKVRGLDQLQAALGSRGVLRSGSTIGGAQQNQRAYEQTMYGAERSTLDTLSEALRGYTSGIGARQGELASIASNVGSRLAQDPRFQPRTVTASFDPSRGAYVTAGGGLYDRFGNKIG